MLGSKYYKLYNRLLSEATSNNDIIDGFVSHLVDVTPELVLIYGAVIEKGCLYTVSSKKAASQPPDIIPLSVSDVHWHIFGLENYYQSTTHHIQGLPFLSHDAVQSLSAYLTQNRHGNDQLINLMFFCDGFLRGFILMVFPEDYRLGDGQLNELFFLRDSIEALIYKSQRSNDNHLINHLMATGETIVKSTQHQDINNHIFLERLLNLCFELSEEADYGSTIIYENGFWSYAHVIGHNASALKQIHLPGDIYLSKMNLWEDHRELAPNIFLVPHILDPTAPAYDNIHDVINKVINASQPIKETLQLHIFFDGVLKAVISLDIKAGSPVTFTNKTIHMMRRIDFLSQILFTNASLNMKSRSFEQLTDLITNLVSGEEGYQEDFLNDYLKLIVDSIYEADYASAYIRDSKSIKFLAAVGHDLKGLQKIPLKPEYFISSEEVYKNRIPFVDSQGKAKPASATLFTNLNKYDRDNMPKDIFKLYSASTKPVKDVIVSQAKLTDDAYMYITCDVKEDSTFSFSKDSIKLFSALNNLGFSFISNQYYIDSFKTLNAELENKIMERTMALEISNRKLKAIADKDSMTGLLNHKTIINELERMTDSQKPLSILLLDIDHFKRVNDTYGHQTGDEVLIGISELLMENHQLIQGRYGGEEFLILMPDFDQTSAEKYCQELFNRIKSTRFIEDSVITISGGLITRVEGNASELISAADTLLYQAKSNGRDQFIKGYR